MTFGAISAPPAGKAGLVRILLNTGQTGNAAAEERVIIYLDDYRKAQALKVAKRQRYDEEVLCVSWNPAVVGLAPSGCRTSHEPTPLLPDSHSQLDADAFLMRVYALATHV